MNYNPLKLFIYQDIPDENSVEYIHWRMALSQFNNVADGCLEVLGEREPVFTEAHLNAVFILHVCNYQVHKLSTKPVVYRYLPPGSVNWLSIYIPEGQRTWQPRSLEIAKRLLNGEIVYAEEWRDEHPFVGPKLWVRVHNVYKLSYQGNRLYTSSPRNDENTGWLEEDVNKIDDIDGCDYGPILNEEEAVAKVKSILENLGKSEFKTV